MLTSEMLQDPVKLTRALVDIPSVSGDEKLITDVVQAALEEHAPHLQTTRYQNTLVARTTGNRERVILAGHLDTVPIADNLPARQTEDKIYGCGTTDMKSGAAVALHLAATQPSTAKEITYIFYDCEEIAAEHNGLGKLAREHPEQLQADLAILLEPTDGQVEAGCQGSMRAELTLRGKRAHAARAWMGDNAIHHAATALQTLTNYQPRTPLIDGCHFHEGLNAVAIRGGVAGNVIPDECVIEIAYRFAPDRTVEDATKHVAELFPEGTLETIDASPGALPGLDAPAAQAFIQAVGAPTAKLGWTDVARFASLGIPAINYGPGDPNLAHTQDEYVRIDRIMRCADLLRAWLG